MVLVAQQRGPSYRGTTDSAAFHYCFQEADRSVQRRTAVYTVLKCIKLSSSKKLVTRQQLITFRLTEVAKKSC